MHNLTKEYQGKPVTTSRMVALKFKKRHDNVLRDIQNLSCSKEFYQLNFEECSYRNENNREMPEYIISKDGFTFLVMGYTGKEAAKFKEDYINAFNAMQEKLRSLAPPSRKQLAQWVVEAEEVIELQKSQLRVQAPKVAYDDKVLTSKDAHTVTVIAKELDMTATGLNNRLRDLGVQYKVRSDDSWVLTAKYQGKGYTKTRTHPYTGSDGETHTRVQLVWTEKGRLFIHGLIGRDR